MADKHTFLSPDWIEAAKRIRDEYRSKVHPPAVAIRMNQVVTDGPDGQTIHTHIDTSDGEVIVELGHLTEPDLTVTADYETVKAVFVRQDAQAGMQAFMSGKIQVEGDVSKLLLLQAQAGNLDPMAAEIAQRVKEITAD